VFRAEKHNTVRHLNEYVTWISRWGTSGISRTCAGWRPRCCGSYSTGSARSPRTTCGRWGWSSRIDAIPMVRFDEAKRAAAEAYGRRIRDPYDLEPEEEVLIGRYYKKRPVRILCSLRIIRQKASVLRNGRSGRSALHAQFRPAVPRMEVTTGGQRIHDYGEQSPRCARRTWIRRISPTIS
jgi:nondiscriminating aspartyl-tRNA synthetase